MKPQICNCKNCNESYDKNKVKRAYGKESYVYMLGFCTAKCYTEKSLTPKK